MTAHAAANKHLDSLALSLTQLKNRQPTINQPIILLIGDEHSGKTTLLHSADASGEAIIAGSPIFLLEHGIYIETDSTLVQGSSCKAFYKLLKTVKAQNTINGIAVSINLADYLRNPAGKVANQLLQLQQALTQLTKLIKHRLPITVIFTHCDQIYGFNEFFAANNQKLNQSPWGMRFQQDITNQQQLKTHFSDYFADFVQQLQQQQIWRLAEEKDERKHSAISHFPLQIESLQTVIEKWLHHLLPSQEQHFDLRQCCFVSSCQQGARIDRLSRSLPAALMSDPTANATELSQQSYFSHQLINHDLFELCRNQKQFWSQKVKHAMAISCSAIVMVGLTLGFRHDFQLQQAVQRQLQQLQFHHADNNHASLAQVLNQAEQLSQIQHKLQKQWLPKLSQLFFHQQPQLLRSLTAEKQMMEQQIIMPAILQLAQNELAKTDLSAEQRFDALAIYLMLLEPKHRDQQRLNQWLKTKWPQPLWQKQGKRAFLQAIPFGAADRELIVIARQQLRKQPLPLLLYLTLKKQQRSERLVTIPRHTAFLAYVGNAKGVPYLFTKEGFLSLADGGLEQFIQRLPLGHWIIGPVSLDEDPLALTALRQQITTLYLADYINWWNLFFYNIRIKPFTTAKAGSEAIRGLANDAQQIKYLIELIQENTKPINQKNKAAMIFNQKVAHQFNDINQLDATTITRLKKPLLTLAKELQKIADAANPSFAAFEFSKQVFAKNSNPFPEFEQLIKKIPQPINGWLTAASVNSWGAILNASEHYINQAWQREVLNFYRSKIAAKFPLDLDASDEIKLANFDQFFNYGGVLDKFYQYYLADFIDPNHALWQPRERYGFSLQLARETIDNLQRGRLMRRMFFSAKSHQLAVTFTLQPDSFGSNISDSILNLGSEQFFDYQGSQRRHQFTWPFSQAPITLGLAVERKNGQSLHYQANGAFNFFRFIHSGQVMQLHDPQHFKITFGQGNNQVSYYLTAEQLINPFVSGITEQFTLPAQLLKAST